MLFKILAFPLSFSGRAVVINALPLSRIWYVALLLFFLPWAHAERNMLISVFSGLVRKIWWPRKWSFILSFFHGIHQFLSPVSFCPVG